jgi:hypothetical protein
VTPEKNVSKYIQVSAGRKLTILTLALRFVEHNVCDMEVGNVADVERHDVVIALANIVIQHLARAIGLRLGC